jgi:catechol 2,3-dioxygenase-like lactoylglutathione lyase family enzyme
VDLVNRIGYVALGVPDLDRAVDFYRRFIHLDVSERGSDMAFMTGGTEHHWLRLHQSDQTGVVRIGYQVERGALDEIVNRLDEQKIPWEAAGGLQSDRLKKAIRFRDPNGVEIELYDDMVTLPKAPPVRDVQMTQLLHAVWLTQDPGQTADFWGGVLGFLPSDWIEDMGVFMRCGNKYHHSMAALRTGQSPGRLDHFCILVPEIDDVLRARNIAMAGGVRLRQDVIRHAASGSISTYLIEPHANICVEFCVDHGQITDPDYEARTLLASPATADVWQPFNFDMSGHAGEAVASTVDELTASPTAAVITSSR